MAYNEEQQALQSQLLKEYPDWFNEDRGGGYYKNKPYTHILQTRENNLWCKIRKESEDYFVQNKISWHPYADNMKSSQVACLNHLMPIRRDKDLLLKMLNACAKRLSVEFDDLYSLPGDKAEGTPSYVGFEVVSTEDRLNEGKPTRGAKCTSIDALLYARDTTGKKWLILVEWKYTEKYKGAEETAKGLERRSRYDDLISESKFLQPECTKERSIYYQEPFYQLMRQTLWAEQVVKHKEGEALKADEVLHLHIIPKGNTNVVPKQLLRELLSKQGVAGAERLRSREISTKHLEDFWRNQLTEMYRDRYQIVDPKDLFASIEADLSQDYKEYLSKRYWQ